MSRTRKHKKVQYLSLLPNEIIAYLATCLDRRSLMNFARTCKLYSQICGLERDTRLKKSELRRCSHGKLAGAAIYECTDSTFVGEPKFVWKTWPWLSTNSGFGAQYAPYDLQTFDIYLPYAELRDNLGSFVGSWDIESVKIDGKVYDWQSGYRLIEAIIRERSREEPTRTNEKVRYVNSKHTRRGNKFKSNQEWRYWKK